MTQTNRLFSELAAGDTASITRVVTPDDLYVFARQRQFESCEPADRRLWRPRPAAGPGHVGGVAVLSGAGQHSDRGQIRGGIVDGPLAMDNAISLAAAKTKGLTSLVAGRADILVVPNLEAGNILAKELTYAAQAEGAGLVLGAKVPALLTSRADDERARLFSCAVAALYAHWQAMGQSAVPPRTQP